ncbi:MAG: hybrid sensor histidine kinase/response regulator [Anaerolineae bacterium]
MSIRQRCNRLSNREELTRSLALKAALVMAILAWGAWYQEMTGKQQDFRLTLVTLGGGVLILALAFLRWLPTRWIAFLQVVTASGALCSTYLSLGYYEAAPFFVLPVILAGLLVSPSLALPLAIAAWLLLGSGSDPESLWTARTLVLVVGSLTALLVRDYDNELVNAWRYAEERANLARELRLQQQQVRALNKALNLSNGLLKRSLGELTAAQGEAEEARRLKEQFATTVSHELRTPLNVILGFAEVIQRYPEVYGDVTWTPELRRDISEIHASARYLSELVDDILDLARIQALKMPIRREMTDIVSLIREVAGLTARLLLDKEGVSLRLELPEQLPQLHVDRTRIRQVLLNLLANAARFTARGYVAISASLGDDEVVLSVADTGTGIPPDQLQSIFDEFSQARGDDLESLHRLGKGLGLAIAKRFVRMHGGRIWAESVLGQGSTFYFTLPLVEKQVVSLATPPLQQPREAAVIPKVVVVGSSQTATFFDRRLDGFEVIQAANLVEARKLVRELHPQAVITNVPPEPHSASQGTSPPILPEPVPLLQCSLLSVEWEPELFDDWLVKPIDSAKLLQSISRWVSARRVLVVDDDASFAHLVERILEVEGSRYEVVYAHNGKLAVEIAEAFHPDVVLLDIVMPGLGGREVARALRTSSGRGHRDLHILAVTAVQPGVESMERRTSTFAVTVHNGLTEEETFLLIKSCLAHLKPAYLPELADSAS